MEMELPDGDFDDDQVDLVVARPDDDQNMDHGVKNPYDN